MTTGDESSVARRVLFMTPAYFVLIGLFLVPMTLLLVVSFWTVRSFKLQPDLSIAAYARVITAYSGVFATTMMIGITRYPLHGSRFCLCLWRALSCRALRRCADRDGLDHPVRRLSRQDLRLEGDPRCQDGLHELKLLHGRTVPWRLSRWGG